VPLLADLKVEDVISMTVAEAEGRTLTLKQEAGSWVLADTDGFLARADRITPLLDKLVAMNSSRLVARTDSSHRQLQVADSEFVRRVSLGTSSGNTHTVYVGSSPSYNASHVRVDGKNETYMVSNLNSWEFSASASSWITATLIEVAQDQLTQVQITNAKGTVTLTKDGQGKWSVQGLAGDQDADKISTAVSRACSVPMTKPLGKALKPEYGLDKPSVTVVLKTAAQTIQWEAGALLTKESGYVVRSSNSPYFVAVADYNLTTLLENGKTDYLKPVATPTAAK
jgi:hypothetical protein